MISVGSCDSEVGVCDIYIVIVVLTMCNLITLSILQKPNKTATLRSARSDEGVKQCMRAFRACSFTAWFSRLKCIKSDRKIQDMGQKIYIFTFHMIKITQRVQFFSPKISTITNVILTLYNSSINNKLISRDLHFRHHIAYFCCISPTKIILNSYSTVLRLWATWQWFVHEWTV